MRFDDRGSTDREYDDSVRSTDPQMKRPDDLDGPDDPRLTGM